MTFNVSFKKEEAPSQPDTQGDAEIGAIQGIPIKASNQEDRKRKVSPYSKTPPTPSFQTSRLQNCEKSHCSSN
jgi:hypothetical protein